MIVPALLQSGTSLQSDIKLSRISTVHPFAVNVQMLLGILFIKLKRKSTVFNVDIPIIFSGKCSNITN